MTIDFYCLMNDDSISEEDYKHAEGMLETFNLEDMGKYHGMYLRLDIPQPADVFDNSRKTYKQYYR